MKKFILIFLVTLLMSPIAISADTSTPDQV